MNRLTKRYRDVFTQLAKVTSLDSGSTHSFFYHPFLGIIITLVPVFLGCCNAPLADSVFTETRVSVKAAVQSCSSGPIKSMDILVFDDDIMQRLDCWQRFENIEGHEFNTGSQSGPKVFFACANTTFEPERWASVGSLADLNEIRSDLESDSITYPLMTGYVRGAAGSGSGSIALEKLFGEIRLNTLCCSFTGKPYQGERLTDIKVYLTNVNATCRICAEGPTMPERIINSGRASEDDIRRFPDPGMIYRELTAEVGETTVQTDVRFICYPNNSETESPGTPFTRLVIEGKIQGETWYWPIDINRESGNIPQGISRGSAYIYDITITSKGAKDPNIPVKHDAATIRYVIEKWKEREDYAVLF